MGYCPKCGRKIKKRSKSRGVRWCPRHGAIEQMPKQPDFIAVPVPEKGEIFTHKDEDGTIRNFALCMMRNFVRDHANKCELIIKKSFTITAPVVAHIRARMGIEQDRLDRLAPPYLDEPIIGIVWMDAAHGDTFTVIDGNHRIVKKFEHGKTDIDVWVFHPLIWNQFLLTLPEAISEFRLTAPSRVIEFEQGSI